MSDAIHEGVSESDYAKSLLIGCHRTTVHRIL